MAADFIGIDDSKDGVKWIGSNVWKLASFAKIIPVINEKNGTFGALKYFTQGYEKREEQIEITLLKKFRHENIVKFLGEVRIIGVHAYQDVDRRSYVMELCAVDLEDAVRGNSPTNAGVFKEACHQIFCGLAYIHRSKIHHNDLSMSNILIDGNSRQVKICDFGHSEDLSAINVGDREQKFQIEVYKLARSMIRDMFHGTVDPGRRGVPTKDECIQYLQNEYPGGDPADLKHVADHVYDRKLYENIKGRDPGRWRRLAQNKPNARVLFNAAEDAMFYLMSRVPDPDTKARNQVRLPAVDKNFAIVFMAALGFYSPARIATEDLKNRFAGESSVADRQEFETYVQQFSNPKVPMLK